MSIKVIAIAGPTASGKTSATIEIAKRYNGEIISADSMQIYKYMDIGTAKPDEAERDGILHHMFDVVEPWEEYSVAEYAKDATVAIKKVAEKEKLPILCGGTGLYINTLVENIKYDVSPEMNVEILAEIEKFYEEVKNCKLLELKNDNTDAISEDNIKEIAEQTARIELHKMLINEDFEAAEQIHFNNVKRVIRALGMKRSTGMTLAQRNVASKSIPSEFDFTVYAIETDREKLYDRINLRVDLMLEIGLLDEVQNVLKICEEAYKKGLSPQKGLSRTALQAIGYKEFINYFNGECNLEEAVERVKQGSRNYAKRQLTWFRKPSWVNWIKLDELKNITL